MRTIIRAALTSMLAMTFFVGPVSAATTSGITIAQAAQSGTITGTVLSDDGTPVSAAQVTIAGAGLRQTAATDDSGTFTVSLPPGLYSLTVNKGGFQTGTTDVSVAAGTSTTVGVTLTTASLNSLNVIGRTTSGGTGNGAKFNIGASPAQTLTQAQIQIRNTPELTAVMNQLPGITIPHATTNPNQTFIIRGFRYETRVELDGHPVSSGTGGTFLTNYASAGIFGGVDLVKGAGLNGPIAGYAGVGIANLRTPDFTAKDSGFIKGGLDQFNGSFYNYLADLNFMNGKLSLILAQSFSGYRGPTYGTQQPNYSGAFINTNGTYGPPTNLTNGVVSYITDFSDTYSLNAQLAKLRFKFSDATSFTAEFLGLQGRFDPQGGAYGQFAGFATVPQCLNSNVAGNGAACTVTSTYNTPAAAGLIGQSGVPLYAFFPGSDVRQNQPNFNADIKTTIKNDTLLFRPYTAAINRLIDGTQENTVPGDGGAWFQVTKPANCQATFVAPSVANGGAKGPCFAGATPPVAAYIAGSGVPQPPTVYATTTTPLNCSAAVPCYTTPTGLNNSGQLGYGSPFTTLELDNLFGYTFSYIHPVGANTYNLSFDHYFDDASALINDTSPLAAGCSFVISSGQANTPGTVGYQPNCPLATLRPSPISVPETFSSISSLALTAQFALTPNFEFDFGGYFTHYLINAQQQNPAVTALYAPSGRTGAAPISLIGVQNSASHFDPHFGFVYRPSQDWVVRFTGGSSMVIPYASLVSGFTTYQQGSASTTISTPNAGLAPEEVVQVDLGSDYRTPDGTVLSGDIYNIVVHNPWIFTKVSQCVGITTCAAAFPGLEQTAQIFTSQTLNGAQQYGTGIEFSITNEPAAGFGYRVNTSLERNYYLYNPAAFFTSPQTFFNGQQFQSSGSTTASVPYAKAYSEVQYAERNGNLIRFGADYEGPNNSYNALAFWFFDAGARFNTGFHNVMIGASVENVLNLNFNAQLARGVEFQGLAPIAATAAPNGYTYSTPFSTGLVSPGPMTIRFYLSKQF